MKRLQDLKVKIYADGANVGGMLRLGENPLIRGFTTNPTLMRKAGVPHYEEFAREVLRAITDRPVCFEVLSDELDEMERQARKISAWGPNVYVKVPITNTRSVSTLPVVRRLAADGIRLNVTALLTLEQVREVADALVRAPSSYISVFAGRIADTGIDPVPVMAEAVDLLRHHPHLELIWASPRELLNVFQADAIGCHIITVTYDILGKLHLVGRDLIAYSLETVQMFRSDAEAAGYTL